MTENETYGTRSFQGNSSFGKITGQSNQECAEM